MQHANHDTNLIAGLAADDLTPLERDRAQVQLDSCAECSTLRDDLLAIAQATLALPAQPAPRDFRITAEQAARLRHTSWLGRLLAPFSGARSAARPLAATFTTLGLVGVFVAAALPSMLGGAATAGPSRQAGDGSGSEMAPEAAGAVASAAPGAMFGPAFGSGDPEDNEVTKDSGASGEPTYVVANAGGGDSRDGGGAGTTGGSTGSDNRLDAMQSPPNLLLLGSVGFLVVGLGLFGLRFAGRRFRS